MEEKIGNLDFCPTLKEQLIEWCYANYEENAIIDDEHLLKEYYMLQKENRLHVLHEVEHMRNRIKYEYEQSRENFG
jgi:hypothetical protein